MANKHENQNVTARKCTKMTLKNCNVHSLLLFFPEKVSNEVSKCMTILDQTLSHCKFHTNLSINVKTKNINSYLIIQWVLWKSFSWTKRFVLQIDLWKVHQFGLKNSGLLTTSLRAREFKTESAMDFAGSGLDVEYLTQFYAFIISCLRWKG